MDDDNNEAAPEAAKVDSAVLSGATASVNTLDDRIMGAINKWFSAHIASSSAVPAPVKAMIRVRLGDLYNAIVNAKG